MLRACGIHFQASAASYLRWRVLLSSTGFLIASTSTDRSISIQKANLADQALAKVMQHLLKDDTQVYKQFVENESFKRFVGEMVYALTSE
jgi:hypothetical protein